MSEYLFSQLANVPDCTIIFYDFFSVVLQNRPDYDHEIRLWSKNMIRELAIPLSIEQLSLLRLESENYLSEVLHKTRTEIPYDDLVREVFHRLFCTDNGNEIDWPTFRTYFEDCEYKIATLVQQTNKGMLKALLELKEKGYTLYGVSNFHGSADLATRMMTFHGLQNTFDDVYVSSEFKADNQNSSVYDHVLSDLKLQENQVVIIQGDTNDNESIKSKLDIKAIRLQSESIENSSYAKAIASLEKGKAYRRIVRKLYNDCNKKSSPPHSDYILFYYVYIERLYKKAKKDKIKNIFFLAREGLFLKRLFDHYQNEISIKEKDKINAHYFKASRNSLMLASFKDIGEEEFEYLRRRWPTLSVNNFLKNFNFSEQVIATIAKSASLEEKREEVLNDFLDSEAFQLLKEDPTFISAYDNTRNTQKQYFEAYLDSFDIDIWSEGFHLSDVGWGGTMQNRLYDFFEKRVKVHGYYLGVREINNIRPDTKKYGLNFSVYPYTSFFDHILMANIELNEQLLAAGHGSTIAYTDKSNSFTVEHHEENDKKVYEAYIEDTQDFMFDCFKELTNRLQYIGYDEDLQHYEMFDHALRIGLFASKRKVRREVDIYKGFYQNVGNFSVGLALGKNFGREQKIELLKNLFMNPEESFRYVLRFKPMLMRRNKYFLAYFIPTILIYWQIKIRCHLKGLAPKTNNESQY